MGNDQISSGVQMGVSSAAVHNHLELLADMGRDFASNQDLELTLRRAVERIADYVDAEAGALFMLSPCGLKLQCNACIGPVEIRGLEIAADQGIVGFCVQRDAGRIVRDVSKDPDFNASVDDETGFKTKSILCAPMSVKGERIGAIELINKRGGDGLFGDDDLHLLQALSFSAGLAVLNARMAAELVEQERVKRELELAAEIQRSLLPALPEPGSQVFGINKPARMVSGDFYDFFTLADGRLCFNLGDVSGKGMNAALLMAKTASLFHCLGKTIHHPGELLGLINEELCEAVTRGMFVTMLAGVYDPRTGIARIANAGHEPPLLLHLDGTFEDFPADAPPLGILALSADAEMFPEIEVNFAGGTFYVFTDGVTEGYLANGETLGVDGFKAVIRELEALPLAERLDAIVGRFDRGDVGLRDDLTILAVEDRR